MAHGAGGAGAGGLFGQGRRGRFVLTYQQAGVDTTEPPPGSAPACGGDAAGRKAA